RLGEGAPPAVRGGAGEAPNGERETNRVAAPRYVEWPAPIAAVDAVAQPTARRAAGVGAGGFRVQHDGIALPADTANHEPKRGQGHRPTSEQQSERPPACPGPASQ